MVLNFISSKSDLTGLLPILLKNKNISSIFLVGCACITSKTLRVLFSGVMDGPNDEDSSFSLQVSKNSFASRVRPKNAFLPKVKFYVISLKKDRSSAVGQEDQDIQLLSPKPLCLTLKLRSWKLILQVQRALSNFKSMTGQKCKIAFWKRMLENVSEKRKLL